MPPNRHTEGLFEQADATASTLASNGEIRFNLGDSTKGTGIDAGVPFWGTDGFLSRPADPDANGAAQIFFVNDGNLRRCIGSRDRRYLAQAGTIDPGDRSIYTPTGLRIFLDSSTKTVKVTGTSTTVYKVALYDQMQSYLQELMDTLQLLIAGDPGAIPPVPGLGTLLTALPGGAPLGTALIAQLAILVAASVTALDELQAASNSLQASTD
jgi:hypothetical protein